MNEPRIVEVRRKILKENDVIAGRLRARFQALGLRVISLVSSPGSGKTSLLERLLAECTAPYRVAALVGDLATDNDAARLRRSGTMVKQISTGSVCHLEARMVEQAIEGWSLENLDLLLIENVGNLVCPSSFDLGEDLRLVLVSTTEGEDKPLKYPTIFNTADATVITKLDLAELVGADLEALVSNVHAVRPHMPIYQTSARTGQGLAELWQLLTPTHREAPADSLNLSAHRA